MVEDVKGSEDTETPLFKVKWKIMLFKYPNITWRKVYKRDIK